MLYARWIHRFFIWQIGLLYRQGAEISASVLSFDKHCGIVARGGGIVRQYKPHAIGVLGFLKGKDLNRGIVHPALQRRGVTIGTLEIGIKCTACIFDAHPAKIPEHCVFKILCGDNGG